uniref:SRCR domain-containing protein n=1 Tax=Ficedula albicollis TaxID=59894 RepID=A0A803VTS4_FICAL
MRGTRAAPLGMSGRAGARLQPQGGRWRGLLRWVWNIPEPGVPAAHPHLRAFPAEHQEWRLSGGRDGCAGRVEVFFRGTWSTVCNSTWYETEATVLCRTLGCGDALQRPAFGHTLPGKMVYLCGSLQPSLAQCLWAFNKSAPCYQSWAAGVICNGTGSFPTGFEAWPGSCPLPSIWFLLLPFPGSQGLETLTPTAEVVPRNVTVLHAEEGTPTLGTPPRDSPLFVLCLVLAALLLLSVLAFSAALLRLRKRSAMSSFGMPTPVQVTHSFQRPDAPSGIPNDYRETPNSLPKGSDPLVTAISKDSDSDSEYYEFSSKPPIALSTFYSEHPTSSGIPDTLSQDPCHPGCSHPSPLPTDSLRRHSREDLLPLRPSQDRMEPFPEDGMTPGGSIPLVEGWPTTLPISLFPQLMSLFPQCQPGQDPHSTTPPARPHPHPWSPVGMAAFPPLPTAPSGNQQSPTMATAQVGSVGAGMGAGIENLQGWEQG